MNLPKLPESLGYNGPGFAGLYAGDVVEFSTWREIGAAVHLSRRQETRRTATVLPLLVFPDHVQVAFGSCGYTVDARNFVRLVRRGKRHMAAIASAADICATEYVRRYGAP